MLLCSIIDIQRYVHMNRDDLTIDSVVLDNKAIFDACLEVVVRDKTWSLKER